jgi:hypothetical protein
MQKTSVEAIIKALNDSGVRYLIAGGLAVVAHGYVRFTADVDLILDLEDRDLGRALSALAGLGYPPRAPVALDDFADSATRQRWVREKGLTVFSLYSVQHPASEIDLFVEFPLDFAKAHRGACRQWIAPNLGATIMGLDDLIALKQKAGRSQDLADLEKWPTIRRATQP